MVDSHALFKKLGVGAKFNLKRFKEDAEKFHVFSSSHVKDKNEDEIIDALDFFGTNKRKSIDCTSVVSQETLEAKKCTAQIRGKKEKKKISSDIGHTGETEDIGQTLEKTREKKRKSHSQEPETDNTLCQEAKKNKLEVSNESLLLEHIETTNRFRKEKRIFVHGADIPDPIKTFGDMKRNTSLAIYKNIVDNGYTEPTPIQMQVISVMLQNRELLACAPTGSGKTLSFIIPLIHHLKEPRKEGFRAVILSPTRELAAQIHREFDRMNSGIGLRIHLLTKAKACSNNFINTSTKHFDVLVATPNRLVHMLNQDESVIELNKVEWLVLDEGDKLFEEGGSGFREQIATIYKACDNPHIKHALFSATLANNIEEWCRVHLDDVVRITVGTRNSAAADVAQELMFVGQESGKLIAIRQIIQKGFQPPLLVFVQSKDRAKELFNELIYDGLNMDVMHADRTQSQRENTIKCFRTGKIWILIATELMARGIDFKGVNMVVNYDFPPTAVSYIHRVGRTGRAGRSGKAVTMFTEDDVINLRSIANVMKSSGCDIPDWIMKIKKPNRDMKKKLKKVPIERAGIKTVAKYDKERAEKKKQIVKMSKSKKRKAQ